MVLPFFMHTKMDRRVNSYPFINSRILLLVKNIYIAMLFVKYFSSMYL